MLKLNSGIKISRRTLIRLTRQPNHRVLACGTFTRPKQRQWNTDWNETPWTKKKFSPAFLIQSSHSSKINHQCDLKMKDPYIWIQTRKLDGGETGCWISTKPEIFFSRWSVMLLCTMRDLTICPKAFPETGTDSTMTNTPISMVGPMTLPRIASSITMKSGAEMSCGSRCIFSASTLASSAMRFWISPMLRCCQAELLSSYVFSYTRAEATVRQPMPIIQLVCEMAHHPLSDEGTAILTRYAQATCERRSGASCKAMLYWDWIWNSIFVWAVCLFQVRNITLCDMLWWPKMLKIAAIQVRLALLSRNVEWVKDTQRYNDWYVKPHTSNVTQKTGKQCKSGEAGESPSSCAGPRKYQWTAAQRRTLPKQNPSTWEDLVRLGRSGSPLAGVWMRAGWRCSILQQIQHVTCRVSAAMLSADWESFFFNEWKKYPCDVTSIRNPVQHQQRTVCVCAYCSWIFFSSAISESVDQNSYKSILLHAINAKLLALVMKSCCLCEAFNSKVVRC